MYVVGRAARRPIFSDVEMNDWPRAHDQPNQTLTSPLPGATVGRMRPLPILATLLLATLAVGWAVLLLAGFWIDLLAPDPVVMACAGARNSEVAARSGAVGRWSALLSRSYGAPGYAALRRLPGSRSAYVDSEAFYRWLAPSFGSYG